MFTSLYALYKEHLKFLCGTSTALKYTKDYIREIGSDKDRYEYYNSDLELYIFSKTIGGQIIGFLQKVSPREASERIAHLL